MGSCTPFIDTTLHFARSLVQSDGTVRAALNGLPRERRDEMHHITAHVVGLAIPVGVIRRPQDHNGVVDDVITTVSALQPTDADVAEACAVSAAVAAILDGWGMEGAVDLALFVGRRGETFGTKSGRNVTAEIRAAIDVVEDRLITSGTEALPSVPRLPYVGSVPRGMAYAFAHRDAERAAREGRRDNEDERLAGALAAALSAADQPHTCSGSPEARPPVGLVEELVRLRNATSARLSKARRS